MIRKLEESRLVMEIKRIDNLCQRVDKELFSNIVPYWINYTQDNEYGGFYGRITNDNEIHRNAPKSLILNSRILWTFSVLYQFKKNDEFLYMAERAFNYIINHFFDQEMGGVYWLLDHKGQAIDNRKKIYGQAFTIYALAEYYAATQSEQALEHAKTIFQLIEEHNYDHKNTGYFEASNRDWTIAEDLRLSASDMNEKKSMNTHLHLMEAYTTLYKVWKDDLLKSRLIGLINSFTTHIINPDTYHFILFQDELWQSKSDHVSFGHDIEGSWLLCEAADILGYPEVMQKTKDVAVKMVEKTITEGFTKSYSIYSDRDGKGKLCESVEWWQQAEAIVGFINAYQITNEDRYLDWALKSWQIIEDKIVDKTNGEWFFGILPDGKPDQTKFKVSEWKGPYHNVRTCLEILNRLK